MYRARQSQAASAAHTVPETTTTAASTSAPAAALAAAPKPTNWELRSQAEIVEHIEQHYHAGLRRDVPVLVEEARRVEREHAGHVAVPVGLAHLLESFAAELESHMLKEERVLFPMLRTGARGGPIDMPIRMMEREHEGHDEQLEHIRELTQQFSAPSDASPAWKQLYAGLATLETELRQHIYLENNVLFARAAGGEY
jgi:regulator of cell morphogenesis and NO signaling